MKQNKDSRSVRRNMLTPNMGSIEDKEWLIYDVVRTIDRDGREYIKSGTTSAIRYLYTTTTGKHKVAVARAFFNPIDIYFNKKIGRTMALGRLRRYLAENNPFMDWKLENVYGSSFDGKPTFRFGTIIYETGNAEDILGEYELEIYEKCMLPKIESFVNSKHELIDDVDCDTIVESQLVYIDNETDSLADR